MSTRETQVGTLLTFTRCLPSARFPVLWLSLELCKWKGEKRGMKTSASYFFCPPNLGNLGGAGQRLLPRRGLELLLKAISFFFPPVMPWGAGAEKKLSRFSFLPPWIINGLQESWRRATNSVRGLDRAVSRASLSGCCGESLSSLELGYISVMGLRPQRWMI